MPNSKCDLFIYNSIKPLLICLEKDDLFFEKRNFKIRVFLFQLFLTKYHSKFKQIILRLTFIFYNIFFVIIM